LKRAEIIKGTHHIQNGHDHTAYSAPKDFIHPQHPSKTSQPNNSKLASKPTPSPSQIKSPPPPTKPKTKDQANPIKMPTPVKTPPHATK